MSDQSLVLDERDGIGVIRIDRPAVYNALNSATLKEIASAVDSLASACNVRAIILTGTGSKAFSAGADLDEIAGLDTAHATELMEAGQSAVSAVERSAVPTIAAVNGLALGGGFELVLACSCAVVATTASFGLPESRLGLIPGFGGTQRLARIVGPSVARYHMLTGQRIDAQRAYQLGIAALAPTNIDQLLPTSVQIAEMIAANGPRANRSILEAVNRGADLSLDAALALETRLAVGAIVGDESTEGIAAFREKRVPSFPSGHDW